MSILDLYESGTQKNNLAHFAAIANIALVDGAINDTEKKLLFKFADKLNINENQFAEVLKNPSVYPINPPSSRKERIEYLYDLFRMIFSDHTIDEEEERLILKYAIGLGCSSEKADILIKKSIKIFSGKIDFDDYLYLIAKE